MKNSLEIHGFGSECLGDMIVDGEYYLEGAVASNLFYLIPVNYGQRVPYAYGSFVADCLAFEHVVPMQALPHKSSFSIDDVPWCIKPNDSKNAKEEFVDMYLGDLTESYELAANLAEELWFHPVFRYDLPNVETVMHKGVELTALNLRSRYPKVTQPSTFTTLRCVKPIRSRNS